MSLEEIRLLLRRVMNRAAHLTSVKNDPRTYDYATRERAMSQLDTLARQLQEIADAKEPGAEVRAEKEEDSWEARAERIRNAAIANRPPVEEIERMKAAERRLQEEARRFEREEPEPEEPEPNDEPQEPEPPPKPRESKTLEARTDTRWKRAPKSNDAA